jgi:hypothetical protein
LLEWLFFKIPGIRFFQENEKQKNGNDIHKYDTIIS